MQSLPAKRLRNLIRKKAQYLIFGRLWINDNEQDFDTNRYMIERTSSLKLYNSWIHNNYSQTTNLRVIIIACLAKGLCYVVVQSNVNVV